MSVQAPPQHSSSWPGAPLIALLHPREQTRFVLGMFAGSLGLGLIEMRWLGWPLWAATATVLALILIPGIVKWRVDVRRYGWVTAVLGILVAAQGFHSVEHLVQWIQYHVLQWTPRQANGLLSAANAEWVHFTWNWTVLAVLMLLYGRVRNVWFWLLLAWTIAHTLEHTYMFVRHLDVLAELRRMGVTSVTAQGLPGVLGRDGWLARSPVTQGTFVCRLPGITTANRLDIHFWWNTGETLLLLLAANTFLLKQRRHTHVES